MRRLFLCAAALFVLRPLAAQSIRFNFASQDPDAAAQAIVSAMSDEDALAQTFMFGWQGEPPSPLILEWINTRRIGGVKVFGWNAVNLDTLSRSIGALQQASHKGPFGIPLLVATDQEGGMVRHIKDRTLDTPGNMAIGAGGFPEDAYRAGYYLGRELSILGINMNFAPVVDLVSVKGSALIATRSFGSDPVRAGIFGIAFMKGQARAGIISTAKHFPGHGATTLDSHGTLPRINAGEKTLWERELVPYRMLVKEGLPAVMSGHLAFPQTPAGASPASLSRWFLNSMLREKIGFTGMVITDDLMMYGAFQTTGTLSRTAREALLAGNDMILVSSTPALDDPLWTDLLALMKTDTAFRVRVRDAAKRVLAAKLKYIKSETLIPDPARVREIPDAEAGAFFQDLAARSITVVKKGPLPLEPAKTGRVLLAGRYSAFFDAGIKAFPGASTHLLGSGGLFNAALLADTIIFCLEGREDSGLLWGLQNLAVPNKRRVIVLSCADPLYLEGAAWVDASLALYSRAGSSFIAAFSLLRGRPGGGGEIPVAREAP
ncbi:MAG: glycoside hydrolase family 3 protein [Treponema sp.]|jgi:beta-N-acetylhexosaminidase|nr:glycoside hydrolase family 3 protein [Treponema sp.]